MRVLMINGSPHHKGCTYTALAEVAGQIENQGIETAEGTAPYPEREEWIRTNPVR